MLSAWHISPATMPNAGAGGNAILSAKAASVGHAQSAGYVIVTTNAVIATQANTTLAISVLTAGVGNFDGVLGLSGGNVLLVELNRHGGHASDSVGQQWNVYSLACECNVL